ncbi:MAG: hypothetical protein ACJAZC_002651 [Cryomorphaceae bacterium]|jgi:hypothetical protein
MKFKHFAPSAVLVFLITLASSSHCSGQSDTIYFGLTHHNNIVIKALLNESDSANLMFHTAAHSVTLTTDGAEKQQSIIWDSEEDVKSWGGNSKARFSSSNSLRIGSIVLDSLPIWETINSGPGTDGKIGLDLFYGSAVEMNFTKNILVIHQATPEIPDGFFKVNLEYQDGILFIEETSTIEEESQQNRFLFHTGYGGAILFDDDFSLETQIGSKIKITSEQELKDSYGNTLVTKKGNSPSATLNDSAKYLRLLGHKISN